MADVINGLFESLGGLFILLSVIRLHREKRVRGVSPWHAAFFTAWGWWNLYYYPSLGQWWSFAGGVLIVMVNSIWLGQLVYYTRYPRLSRAEASFEPIVLTQAQFDQIEQARRDGTARANFPSKSLPLRQGHKPSEKE